MEPISKNEIVSCSQYPIGGQQDICIVLEQENQKNFENINAPQNQLSLLNYNSSNVG